jgi:hypothetical protein
MIRDQSGVISTSQKSLFQSNEQQSQIQRSILRKQVSKKQLSGRLTLKHSGKRQVEAIPIGAFKGTVQSNQLQNLESTL